MWLYRCNLSGVALMESGFDGTDEKNNHGRVFVVKRTEIAHNASRSHSFQNQLSVCHDN